MKKDKDLIACINIDMDTLTDYALFCNLKADLECDRSYELSIPRFIDLFDRLGIKATFFFVGSHSIKSKKYIRMLSDSGHEIANQTFSHKIDLAKMSSKEKRFEIEEAGKVLGDITAKSIVGFRAPNYLLDNECLDILANSGYLYDSSMFPTILASIIEIYSYLLIRRCCRIDYSRIFRPLRPYFLKNGLLEIPVSVTPVTRLPFIGTCAQQFGWPYFNLVFREIKLFKKNINYELHAYEVLSRDHDRIADTFDLLPRIGCSLEQRMSFLHKQISLIKESYQIITLGEYASRIRNENSHCNPGR